MELRDACKSRQTPGKVLEKKQKDGKKGTEQGKKAQALSLPLAGLTASALAPGLGSSMSSSSSSSSAESLDLYGIVSGISSATLYESASSAAFVSASATEDWPESSSRSPAPSPSAAARRDARRRDAEANPGRDETTGEDIGRRPRASPREARAKVGRVRSRRRIGEYPTRTGRGRAWASTRSAGARRMADRAVASMSWGGVKISASGKVASTGARASPGAVTPREHSVSPWLFRSLGPSEKSRRDSWRKRDRRSVLRTRVDRDVFD